MPSLRRVAIVGGGLTGLAAAWELERRTDAQIVIYEAADQLGGKVRTHRHAGCLVEEGPDCFFARKPGMREIVDALGMSDQLIEPQVKEFSILSNGQPIPVARGLVNLRSPSREAIAETPLLSEQGRARALRPQPVTADGDISVRDFFTERFGEEFSLIIAEPILAGTHGGGADRLSMRALYPAYLQDGPAENVDGPTFLSFRDGMQALVRAFTQALSRTEIHLGRPVYDIPDADRVLLAIPAPAAGRLVSGRLRDLLLAIPHHSAAILTEATEAGDEPAPGETGFLVPEGEDRFLNGATWSSVKWAGRAPERVRLTRYFLRRGVEPDDLTQPGPSNAYLAVGGGGSPRFCLHHGWTDALPQYELGHVDRLAHIEDALQDTKYLFLAGTSYRGVGVPDVIRQGREAARTIAKSL